MAENKNIVKILINSILGGEEAFSGYGADDQTSACVGIDGGVMNAHIGTQYGLGGIIVPTVNSVIGTTLTTPIAITAVQSSASATNMYVRDAGGSLYVFDSDDPFAGLTGIGDSTEGTYYGDAPANGATYHDNYYYATTRDDVMRYGPLSTGGSPTFDYHYWTSTLSKTATKPTAILDHIDGHLYFASDASTNTRYGIPYLNVIKTTAGVYEGSADNGSVEQLLELPRGYTVAHLCSYGDWLAISMQPGGRSWQEPQRPSLLVLWDTVSERPTKIVRIDSPYLLGTTFDRTTGFLNTVYVAVGSGGYSFYMVIGVYRGGDSVDVSQEIPNRIPTFDGQAMVQNGSDLLVGGFWYDWENYIFEQASGDAAADPSEFKGGTVMRHSYPSDKVGSSRGLHSVFAAGYGDGYYGVDSAPIVATFGVTALCRDQSGTGNNVGFVGCDVMDSNSVTRGVVVWCPKGDTFLNNDLASEQEEALDGERFQSRVYTVGRPFKIMSVNFTLPNGIDSVDGSITPFFVVDGTLESLTDMQIIDSVDMPPNLKIMNPITSTSCSAVAEYIGDTGGTSAARFNLDLAGIRGQHSFVFGFRWKGRFSPIRPPAVALPIEITILPDAE